MGTNSKPRKFHVNTINHFTVSITQHKWLSKGVVESPSTDIIQNPAGHGPTQPAMLEVPEAAGWTRGVLRDVCQPQLLCGFLEFRMSHTNEFLVVSPISFYHIILERCENCLNHHKSPSQFFFSQESSPLLMDLCCMDCL